MNECEVAVDEEERVFLLENKTKEKFAYKLYPNPTANNATLEYSLNANEIGKLELYNIAGSKVASCDLAQDKTQLQFTTEQLQAGIYLYRIIINNKIVETQKLVIIK